ncbi:MAG TPA: exodeoxyribonuclease III [Myxococcales bacterium LLY-WYZ-16_1]|nr:exodeoxyribonuclease III [Myxococcales bacterium LLY-WYZ-16_1]
MRLLTLNLNGIRSASSKGVWDWFRRQKVDVACFQEVRAAPEQMPLRARSPRGYTAQYLVAEKKGYSGVGIWSRSEPEAVQQGLGDPEFDAEGRWLRFDLPEVTVCSLYMPSGSAGPKRQARKVRFMDLLLDHLRALHEETRSRGREAVVCGDWNIAHRPIDLENWRGNQKNSGFLPEERAWLDRVFDELGFVDVFRRIRPEPKEYTWWSNRGRAWEKNVGWRIDYQLATPGLAESATSAWVYRRRRFSDHAPVTVDYDLSPR